MTPEEIRPPGSRPPASPARDDDAPGSTLVLYTDGLIERRDRSVDAGLDALTRVATREVHRPVQGLCEATLAALAGPASGDDACIFAVHRPSR